MQGYSNTSRSSALILHKGQSVRLDRPANTTTGYTLDILLSPGLFLESENYVASTSAQIGIVGAGGTKIWNIKAVKEGTQYIVLWNHRRWEKDDLKDAEIIRIEVSEFMNEPNQGIQNILPMNVSYQSCYNSGYSNGNSKVYGRGYGSGSGYSRGYDSYQSNYGS